MTAARFSKIRSKIIPTGGILAILTELALMLLALRDYFNQHGLERQNLHLLIIPICAGLAVLFGGILAAWLFSNRHPEFAHLDRWVELGLPTADYPATPKELLAYQGKAFGELVNRAFMTNAAIDVRDDLIKAAQHYPEPRTRSLALAATEVPKRAAEENNRAYLNYWNLVVERMPMRIPSTVGATGPREFREKLRRGSLGCM